MTFFDWPKLSIIGPTLFLFRAGFSIVLIDSCHRGNGHRGWKPLSGKGNVVNAQSGLLKSHHQIYPPAIVVLPGSKTTPVMKGARLVRVQQKKGNHLLPSSGSVNG